VREISWGQAKREVIALQAQIIERLEKGETIRQVWLSLKSEGKVTVALQNFYIHVGRIRQKPSNKSGWVTAREHVPARLSSPRSTSLIAPVPPAEAAVTRADDPHFPTFTLNNRPDLSGDW